MSPRLHLPALMLLGLVLFTAGLGLRDPWPPDEPRFALVAKEMVDTGEWLFPHRNGELYPDKPPLFMWAIAACYLATGSLGAAFLLPSAIAGLATLLLFYDLARRLWTRRVAFIGSLALLATVQFTLQARTAQIDAVLALWTTLAVYGLVRHLLLGPAWGWWYAAFAFMGLGVITKGVGFLPALLLLPYAFARRRRWPGVPAYPFPVWRIVTGLGTMLAVIGAWLVPMLVTVAESGSPALQAYRDNILLKQTATRYVAAWHHERWPGFFLFQVAPWAWVPVTIGLPWLVPAWWRRVKRHEARTFLLVGWVALVLLFFTLSPGKRGVYILPAAPAFVLAAAPLLPGLLRRGSVQRAARWCLTFFAVLLTLVGALATWGPPAWMQDALARNDAVADALAEPALALGLAGLALALGFRRRAPAALAGFIALAWLAAGWWMYPLLNPIRSAVPFMEEVETKIGPSASLAIVAWREQLVLAAHRPVKTFGYARSDMGEEAREAASWASRGPGRWVLIPLKVLEPCFDIAMCLPMRGAYSRDWYLAPATAVTSQCRAAPASPPHVAAR